MSNVIDLNAKRKERDPYEDEDQDQKSVVIDAETMYNGIVETLETYDFVSQWSEESKKIFVDSAFSLLDSYAKSLTSQKNGFDYLMFTLEVLVKTYNKQVYNAMQGENNNEYDS